MHNIYILKLTIFFINNLILFTNLLQIQKNDRLSPKICHACISYLNSWQSFKNRCIAAQKRHRGALELLMVQARAKQKSDIQHRLQQQQQQQQRLMDQQSQQQHRQRMQLMPSNRILKNVLSQPSTNANHYSQQQQHDEYVN